MSQIITKDFYGTSIRLIVIENREFFMAKDVAKLLGYKDTINAIKQHCKNSISFNDFLKGGKTPPLDLQPILGNSWKQTKIIPESDVWRLIIKSRLEEAERIEKWIMEDVLPSIRKTGSYSISHTPENPLKKRTENLRFAGEQLDIFEKAFFKIGITQKEELAITSNRAVKNETEIDFIKLAGKEGIETDTKFRTVTDLCEYIRGSDKFSDEAKLSVSTKKNDKPRPQKLNEILRDNDFQEKIDGDYRATEKGEKFSQFVQNKSKYSAKTVYHTVWKLEVLKEIFF